MPILCRRLRDRQEYLHGTYAEKIFIPQKSYMSTFGDKLPAPLITQSGGSNLYSSFENRLLRTRHLVTRTSAEREWEFTTRIRAALLSRYKTVPTAEAELSYKKMRARSEFGGALNANTAFANLLERKGSLQDVIQLTNENFHVVNCGATHFTMWDAKWLFFGGKSENYSIEDLTSSEDLFVRTEVSEDESLRVGSIPLRPIIGNQKIALTTTTVGLYQIGSGMYEWAEDLFRRLVEHRDRVKRPLSRDDALQDYEVNPEWVNDDTLIIGRCRRDTSGTAMRSTIVCLVSADKRLGHQLSNSCNVQVYRVDPRWYIPYALARGWDPVKEPDPADLQEACLGLSEERRLKRVYVDTGSVNAFLTRVSHHDGQGGLIIRKPLSSTIDPKTGKRVYRYTLTQVKGPTDVLRGVIHQPVQLPKRFRVSRGDSAETGRRRSSLSLASALSKKSWRVGV